MDKELFNKKASRFRSKPNYIKAAKYEKGMENGWYLSWNVVGLVVFHNDEIDESFDMSDYELFDTEEEAFEYIKNHPITIDNGIEYANKFDDPKPCLKWTEKVTVEGDWVWDNEKYELLEEDSWLIQWEGLDVEEISIYSDSFMKSDWDLVE